MSDAIAVALAFGGDPIAWRDAFLNRNAKNGRWKDAPWSRMVRYARRFRSELVMSYAERDMA